MFNANIEAFTVILRKKIQMENRNRHSFLHALFQRIARNLKLEKNS